ncbi:MAG TPA: aminotransferase class V-fold PLP-dependent enzyme [Kiritimatiellia bacterium]|nr:aminotransferase class V-fold PLP-dependent enzyme [Kiritimatiellia bacterium]HSA19262.1 aminotransferase class V-fold PLP-dependent enzyme [Kiritimatiellia bacterium]
MRSASRRCSVPSVSSPITRRRFIEKLGAGTLATLALWHELRAESAVPAAPPPAPGTPSDDLLAAEEAYFADFAKVFTIADEHKYLVASQKGSMPIPILRHFKEGLDRIARDPFPVYLEPSAVTRAKIAKGYGARVDEIAISRNTTDAISQILHGLDWRAGDEILCSTLEYPNCVATVRRVAGRFGLAIRQFGVPSRPDFSAEEIVESARRRIAPGKTKAMFFSCPAHPSGVAMPVRRLARLAQEHGITTVVDGAHYGGMFVPRLDETGIDFWGISGHKWQCGPGGTGILYARNARWPANPNPLPRFHIVRSGDLDAPTDGSRPEGFDLGAALSVYGFPESADWRALGEVCEFWDEIGRERIQNYILALADYARAALAAAFGEQAIVQPCRDPELRSGIVAFNPLPEPAQRRDPNVARAFQSGMEAAGYHVGCGGTGLKGLTRPPDPDAADFFDLCIPNRDPETNRPAPGDIPFRTGTPAWCNRDDMDGFVGACAEVMKKVIG